MRQDNSVTEDIMQRINDMIFLNNRFHPGDKLPNERDFSAQLGVSRNSLREAIKLLESKGILVSHHGRGTFVAEQPGVSHDLLGLSIIKDREKISMDLYEVRALLEVEAVQMAAQRATDEEIAIIEEKAAICEEQIQGGAEWLRADHAFHIAISQATHNEVLIRLIPSLLKSLFAGVSLTDFHLSMQNPEENTLEYLEEIVRFLKLRDPAGAAMAMRYHIQRSRHEMAAMYAYKKIQ